MNVEFTYDWIACTLPYDASEMFLSSDVFGTRVDGKEAIPKNGYVRAAAWESGVVAMWHPAHERMGFRLEMSGSALRWFKARNVSAQYWIDGLHELGGRFSRIDLAIDMHNSALTFADLPKSKARPYKGKGRTPRNRGYQDDDGGWTQYYGSRSSAKFLRIYNKGAEQHVKGIDYIRAEIELKRNVAHALGSALYGKSQSEVFAIASTYIRTMADFDHPAWQAAMHSENVQLSVPKATSRDTFKWLVDTCIPSLVRLSKEKPSDDVVSLFLSTLGERLGADITISPKTYKAVI